MSEFSRLILIAFLFIVQRITSDQFCYEASEDDQSKEDADDLFDLILAEKYEQLHPNLPDCLEDLKRRGSYRCWHKHSTFHDHLLNVYKILRLWGQDSLTSFVGLFHSAYSNSYVNLALYDPATERERMVELIGKRAEEVVHIFCSFDRQAVVVDTLLKKRDIPVEGLEVPHLRNSNDTIHLDPEILRILVVFTMADISDQYFGFQDELFGGGGELGSMIIPGKDRPENHNVQALWPGVSKPGLWMSYVSDLAKIVHGFDQKRNRTSALPPIFHNCSARVRLEDEISALELYWSVVQQKHVESVDKTLLAAHEKNPFAFEPLVLLTQLALHANNFEAAEAYGQKALSLIRQWGTAYDKRLSLAATTAWTRVLLQRAVDRAPWPDSAWEVNNLGLVR